MVVKWGQLDSKKIPLDELRTTLIHNSRDELSKSLTYIDFLIEVLSSEVNESALAASAFMSTVYFACD